MKNYRLTTIIIITIAIITGVNCNINAKTLSADDKAILKKHIALLKHKSIDNQQINTALNNHLRLLNKYLSVINVLKTGQPSLINRQIKNLERDKKYAMNYLKYRKKKYEQLKLQYDNLKSDKLKIAEVNKLEARRSHLIELIKQRTRPFTLQENALINKSNIKQKNIELKLLMASLLNPKVDNPTSVADKININAIFRDAFVSCFWSKNNRKIAWMHIKIRTQPKSISENARPGDKYPITVYNNTTIWFWAGNFNIGFNVIDNRLKTKELVKKTLQELIDLPGFKNISDQKIIKQSIAVYESIKKNHEQLNNATEALSQERYKLARQIAALRKSGYISSTNTVILKTRLAEAKESYLNKKNIIATSAKLIKILKTPLNSYPKEIMLLDKIISSMRNEIVNYVVKIKQLQKQQLKNDDFNSLNQQYQSLVNNFIKLPKSREFILINRTDTDVWLGVQKITIKWIRDYSTIKSPNMQTEFYGIINYAPNYPSHKNKGMIDGKYPILRLSDSSITIKAGDFTVLLNSTNKTFYAKYGLIKAIKELYDLNAIANALK